MYNDVDPGHSKLIWNDLNPNGLWLWAVDQNPPHGAHAIEQLEEIETVRCMKPAPFRSEETCQHPAALLFHRSGFSLRTCPRNLDSGWLDLFKIYSFWGHHGHLGIIFGFAETIRNFRQSASSKPQGFQAQLELSIQQWVIWGKPPPRDSSCRQMANQASWERFAHPRSKNRAIRIPKFTSGVPTRNTGKKIKEFTFPNLSKFQTDSLQAHPAWASSGSWVLRS